MEFEEFCEKILKLKLTEYQKKVFHSREFAFKNGRGFGKSTLIAAMKKWEEYKKNLTLQAAHIYTDEHRTSVYCRLTDCVFNTGEGAGSCGRKKIIIIKGNRCLEYVNQKKTEKKTDEKKRPELFSCNVCGHPKGSGGIGDYLIGVSLQAMKNHYQEKHPEQFKDLIEAIEEHELNERSKD